MKMTSLLSIRNYYLNSHYTYKTIHLLTNNYRIAKVAGGSINITNNNFQTYSTIFTNIINLAQLRLKANKGSCSPKVIFIGFKWNASWMRRPHPPLQAAGGIPMQTKYWKVSIQARKQQYFGQISAMAFLLRLYMTKIRAKAWSME